MFKIMTGKEMLANLQNYSQRTGIEHNQKSKISVSKDPKQPVEKCPARSNSKGAPGRYMKSGVKLRTAEDNCSIHTESKEGKSYTGGSSI